MGTCFAREEPGLSANQQQPIGEPCQTTRIDTPFCRSSVLPSVRESASPANPASSAAVLHRNSRTWELLPMCFPPDASRKATCFTRSRLVQVPCGAAFRGWVHRCQCATFESIILPCVCSPAAVLHHCLPPLPRPSFTQQAIRRGDPLQGSC